MAAYPRKYQLFIISTIPVELSVILSFTWTAIAPATVAVVTWCVNSGCSWAVHCLTIFYLLFLLWTEFGYWSPSVGVQVMTFLLIFWFQIELFLHKVFEVPLLPLSLLYLLPGSRVLFFYS